MKFAPKLYFKIEIFSLKNHLLIIVKNTLFLPKSKELEIQLLKTKEYIFLLEIKFLMKKKDKYPKFMSYMYFIIKM